MKVPAAVALLSLLAPVALAVEGEEGLKKPVCNQWPKAPRDNLDKAIKASEGISGTFGVGPGDPATCRRIIGTAQVGTGFWLCNDTENTQDVPGSLVHLAAEKIREECGADEYSGQIFHQDEWNIILRADDPESPVQTPIIETRKKKARKHRKNKH